MELLILLATFSGIAFIVGYFYGKGDKSTEQELEKSHEDNMKLVELNGELLYRCHSLQKTNNELLSQNGDLMKLNSNLVNMYETKCEDREDR